jgi:hypothetical protein
MSYETAPNEAWIAIRRIVVAIPVLRVAPEPVQQKVLSEFETLIRRGFIETTVRAYSDAPGSTRQLLQSRVDQLDPRSQKRFFEALHKFRPISQPRAMAATRKKMRARLRGVHYEPAGATRTSDDLRRPRLQTAH